MNQIIECVPNFSEGRDEKKIAQIKDSIENASTARVLDVSSDPDHNRTVITFAGEPQEVVKSTFAMIKTASEIIDLFKHEGVHPRIGATDVCPLVPISNISIEECSRYAIELGKKVGKELSIPVYLYEHSATTEHKRNLANIRKKSFNEAPDFGPKDRKHHGATVIGARNFLIAYNINLKNSDLKTAKEIAKTIREKDGELPGVKALGLELKNQNCTQVSMNLVNFHETNIHQVYKRVSELAEIQEDELIGLIPQEAYKEAIKHLPHLKKYQDKILEKALQAKG